MSKKIIIIGLVTVLLSSCVTKSRVGFDSNVLGAELYIDGEYYGEIPTTVRLSNAAWKDPEVVLQKEGYRTLYTSLDREVKAVNLVFGVTIWWPSLLWMYGPDREQYYTMREEPK